MRAALARQRWDAIVSGYAQPEFDAPSALGVLREAGLDIPSGTARTHLGSQRTECVTRGCLMTNGPILLVEDSQSDVGLTRRALSKCRISNRLVVAEDGEAGLNYLLPTGCCGGEESTEMPALVLLDLNLPKVHGLDVLRRIRGAARTRRVPVVILTSSREVSDLGAGYDAGANSYVVKPVDFNQFREAIEKLGQFWLAVSEPPPPVQ